MSPELKNILLNNLDIYKLDLLKTNIFCLGIILV